MDDTRNTGASQPDRDADASDGYPQSVLSAMKEGHERFMNSTRRDESLDLYDDNPFVSFKRQVDAHFDALLNSLISLPAALTELTLRMDHEHAQRRSSEEELLKRWTHVNDESSGYLPTQVDRASRSERRGALVSTMNSLRRAQALNSNVPFEKIDALFRDDVTPLEEMRPLKAIFAGSHGRLGENADRGLFGNRPLWQCSHPDPTWLSVDWFQQSPYSPNNLQSRERAGTDSSSWRAAFEDLLNVTLDKPLAPVPPNNTEEPERSGIDWMLSLQHRGILPPQLPIAHNLSYSAVRFQHTLDSFLKQPRSDDEPLTIPITVLDDVTQIFNAFLKSRTQSDAAESTAAGLLGSSAASQRVEYRQLLDRGKELSGEDFSDHHLSFDQLHETIARMEQESEALQLTSERSIGHSEGDHIPEAQLQVKKVDVISSLTTTQTTRMPDGTTTTKVVLRERFSDGRETTEEKVHTYRDASSAGQDMSHSNTEQSEQPAKRGWFWT